MKKVYFRVTYFDSKGSHNLKEILTHVIHTLEQQTYLSKLIGYDYTFFHKSGHENQVVDALSRQFEEEDNILNGYLLVFHFLIL